MINGIIYYSIRIYIDTCMHACMHIHIYIERASEQAREREREHTAEKKINVIIHSCQEKNLKTRKFRGKTLLQDYFTLSNHIIIVFGGLDHDSCQLAIKNKCKGQALNSSCAYVQIHMYDHVCICGRILD